MARLICPCRCVSNPGLQASTPDCHCAVTQFFVAVRNRANQSDRRVINQSEPLVPLKYRAKLQRHIYLVNPNSRKLTCRAPLSIAFINTSSNCSGNDGKCRAIRIFPAQRHLINTRNNTQHTTRFVLLISSTLTTSERSFRRCLVVRIGGCSLLVTCRPVKSELKFSAVARSIEL
jgi:hypothetical protein